LSGFLKDMGEEVLQLDMDQRIHSDLLTGEMILKVFSRLEYLLSNFFYNAEGKQFVKKVIRGLHMNPQRPGAFPSEPESFLKMVLSSREKLTEEIQQAIQSYDERHLTQGRLNFLKVMQAVELGTALFSLAFAPVYWSPLDGFQFRFAPNRVQDLLTVIQDKNENPLISYYRERIIPGILEKNPDLIGISLNHFSQFIPGLTLCRMLKESGQNFPILFGGETLTEVSRFLPDHPDLYHLFDYIALGKGEYALEGLTRTVPANLDKIPNLLYVWKGKLCRSKVREEVNIDTLPTPDFQVVKPNPIIPLSLSSGCIWGKCNFCFYPFTQTSGECQETVCYQERSIARVVKDIKNIYSRHYPSFFYFTDHSIPFERLMAIGEGLQDAGITTHFLSFIRAEEEFTDLGNLLRLKETGFIGGYFGLESASQRINNLMNKAIALI
jgi:anaerobic magnesium-protoporphyrin IX monomethyl ester cyclase